MVRPVEQQKRKHGKRERNRIILVGTEGKNKTETIYFKGLNKHLDGYVIRFASGNDTDPLKIVKNTLKSAGKNYEDLDFNRGDMAFSVFDTDTDKSKQSLIDAAIEYGKQHNVEVVLSNPCFEVWYLQHYQNQTKRFNNSNDVIDELHRYISSYKKSDDLFNQLWPNTNYAIDNCKRLMKYHDNNLVKQRSIERNPSSEVYMILEKLCSKKEENI
jgi:hypothetical protein